MPTRIKVTYGKTVSSGRKFEFDRIDVEIAQDVEGGEDVEEVYGTLLEWVKEKVEEQVTEIRR